MARINVPILLLSVALSTSAWFILFGQNLKIDGAATVNLSARNVIGLPVRLHVDEIYPIKLQLSGPSGQVGRVENESHLDDLVSVDLTSAIAGEGFYPLNFDNSIGSVIQSPRTVKVKLEEIISKIVPVRVVLHGNLDDTTSSLTSYPASETSANATGVKSIVDSIREARAILQVDQIDPNNPKSQRAPLVAVGLDGRTYPDVELQPDRVQITPIIGAAQVDKKVIVSANIQGVPAAGYIGVSYKITPSQLQLSGPSEILVNTSSVQTEPVDVSGLIQTKLFKVRIITPRGTSTRTNVAYVRYVVEKDHGLKSGKPVIPAAGATSKITPPGPTGGGGQP